MQRAGVWDHLPGKAMSDQRMQGRWGSQHMPLWQHNEYRGPEANLG